MSEDISFLHMRLRRNLAIIFGSIIYLIYLPICIYGFYKYFKYRNNIILQKRHSFITLNLLVFLMMLLSIFIPILIVLYTNKFNDWDTFGMKWFSPIFIFILLILYIFIWRQWLYYYDIKFAQLTMNKEWHQLLNPMSYETNWFVKNNENYNKNSLNNKLFYKYLFILFLLISATIYVWEILYFHSNPPQETIGKLSTLFFWSILGITFLIILRCKTGKFEDAFFIRKEMSLFIYILIIGSLIMIIDYLINIFVISSTKYHVTMTMCNFFVVATGITLSIMVFTLYVIHKNKSSIIMSNDLSINNTSIPPIQMASISELSSINSNTNTNKDIDESELTLFNVLKNEKMFNEFMQHLIEELSIEIMLSLIELTEFQKTIIEYDGGSSDRDWKLSFEHFIYPCSVPESSIIHNELNNEENALCNHLSSSFGLGNIYENTKKVELLIRSHKLYEKYIKIGSHLEIKISYKHREILIDKMNDFNLWVNLKESDMNDNDTMFRMLFDLFGKAMEEMVALLRYSFLRFKCAKIKTVRVKQFSLL